MTMTSDHSLRLRRKQVCPDEVLSLIHANRVVDIQHINRSTPDRRSTRQVCPIPEKVLLPGVFAGIEQGHQLLRFGIVARGVGAFRAIAMGAGNTSVFQAMRTVMLLGPNVV